MPDYDSKQAISVWNQRAVRKRCPFLKDDGKLASIEQALPPAETVPGTAGAPALSPQVEFGVGDGDADAWEGGDSGGESDLSDSEDLEHLQKLSE